MKTGYVPSLNSEGDFNEEELPRPIVKPIVKPVLSKSLDAHNEEKLSLTIGAVAVGVVGFTLYKVFT